MDFKHKGITWVGNMYQKFEAVCQEVDNIISQETVKYVENQVNSASENVKKFYSDVVQDLLPPIVDPVKCETQAVAQRGSVAINAYFKSLISNEENAANSATNKSSARLGANDLMDKQLNQAPFKITVVNEEGVQDSNHSLLELNADLHLGKNDDLLIDKDLDESIKENAINELCSGKSDGTMMDKHSFMELDAGDLLMNPLRIVSSKNNLTNERANLVCADSDLQLEDETLLRKNDGVFTNEQAISVFDDSHLPLKSSVPSRKNDDALTDEDLDKSLKKDVIMEHDASDPLKNHPSHACSGTNFISEEVSLVSDDSHLLLESEIFSQKDDRALADKDLDKSPIKDAIFQPDASSYFSNLPSRACSRIGFKKKEAIMVSDSNHLQLESDLLSGKNDDALADENSNGSLKNATILEKDASYPIKNQPRCTSTCINYKNEEFTSVSNDSLLKLKSVLFVGKNGEALIDGEADASFKEQANSEFSTELISHFDQKSVNESTYREFCDDVCKEDIVTLTGDLPVTSIRSADAVSSELDPPVLTCGKLVEEMSATCENKDSKIGLASSRSSSLSMQPLEDDQASRAHGSAILPESGNSSNVQLSKCTSSEALIFSEVGCSYNCCGCIPDVDMETVDLRDKVTLQDSCDIVDYRALHAVFRRTQKLRSYKKRIQDAFTSKRRLAKEYEQLAIWYGDTDLEFNTGGSPSLPFSAQTPLDSNSVPTGYASDSEWELL